MRTVVKTSGFAELEKALNKFPEKMKKSTMRRSAKEALEPMRAMASSLAADAPPFGAGLVAEIKIDTKLNPKAKGIYTREGPSEVFQHMGPAPASAKAVVNEFGSWKMAAHPYMRPAWDSQRLATLDRLKESLGRLIMKGAARLGKQAKGG